MTTLRVLTLSFDLHIEPWELRAFRGAISEKVGYQHDHFHNHNHQTGGFYYRYPLIQYKYHHHKPMLVCLNEGVEQMDYFLNQPEGKIMLNGKEKHLKLISSDILEHQVKVGHPSNIYHLRNWLPFNEENYSSYKNEGNLLERIALLERILQNQVVAFAQSIGAASEDPIFVKIKEIQNDKWMSYKTVKMLAFSLIFETNLFIPNYIGIGKGASIGWGIVKKMKR